MTFCSNCGEPTDGRFCEKCGTPVEVLLPPPAPPPTLPPPPPPAAFTPPPPPFKAPESFIQPDPSEEPKPKAEKKKEEKKKEEKKPEPVKVAPPPVPSALPPGVPPAVPPPGIPAAAPVAGGKKRSPLFWVLSGCGVIVLLGVIGFVISGLFVAKKLSEAGLDTDLLKRNPVVAAAKMAATMNPDVEVVSVDEEKGVLTLKERKTGKTVTLNAEDIKNGNISFEDQSTGEKVSLGAQSNSTLPSWVPSYPGSKPEGAFSTTGGKTEGGMVHFKTGDPGPKVLEFYKSELKRTGFRITATMAGTPGDGAGGMVAAENAGSRNSVMVTLSTSSEGTDVAVTYNAKK